MIMSGTGKTPFGPPGPRTFISAPGGHFLETDMNDRLIDIWLLAPAKYPDLIAKMVDASDKPMDNVHRIVMMSRIRIEFKNGYALSVISGKYSYGGENKYEIAVLNPDGDIDCGMNKVEDPSNDVIGHCNAAKVMEYVEHVGTYVK